MKAFKIICNTITTLICLVVAVFVFLLAGVRLFGLTPYTVISGSMEPEIHVGSMAYVKKAEGPLQERDVVTYRLNGATPVTHRIIEVVPDENDPSIIRYRTKGDANEMADGSLIEQDRIIGKVVFSVPYLGYVADYVQNPPGMYVVIGAVVFIIVLMLGAEVFLSDNSKKEEDKPAEENNG